MKAVYLARAHDGLPGRSNACDLDQIANIMIFYTGSFWYEFGHQRNFSCSAIKGQIV